MSKMFWDTKLDILRFLRVFDYLFMSLFLRNTLIFKNISISEKNITHASQWAVQRLPSSDDNVA